MFSTLRTFAARAGFTAALVLAAVSPAQAQTLLRWQFKEGQVFRYEFGQRNEIKVKAEGQEVTSKNDLTVNLTWTVKSVTPDGTADIVMKMDRVRAAVEAGPQKIQYDSKADKPDEGAAKVFHDIYSVAIGPDFKLKINSRGEVLESKVPEKLTAALQASPFAAVADGGSFLSDKGLKNVFAQVVPVLPEKAVAKGATWSGSLELPVQPLKLTLTHKDTLADVSGDAAKITSVLETKIIPDPASQIVLEMKKQEGNGNVSLDTKSGRITESSIVQKIELSLTIMNKMIDQTISIDARLKLIP